MNCSLEAQLDTKSMLHYLQVSSVLSLNSSKLSVQCDILAIYPIKQTSFKHCFSPVTINTNAKQSTMPINQFTKNGWRITYHKPLLRLAYFTS